MIAPSHPFEGIARGMDVVFDTVGESAKKASRSTLRPGGLLASTTSLPKEDYATSRGLVCSYVFIQANATLLEQLAVRVNTGSRDQSLGQNSH